MILPFVLSSAISVEFSSQKNENLKHKSSNNESRQPPELQPVKNKLLKSQWNKIL